MQYLFDGKPGRLTVNDMEIPFGRPTELPNAGSLLYHPYSDKYTYAARLYSLERGIPPGSECQISKLSGGTIVRLSPAPVFRAYADTVRIFSHGAHTATLHENQGYFRVNLDCPSCCYAYDFPSDAHSITFDAADNVFFFAYERELGSALTVIAYGDDYRLIYEGYAQAPQKKEGCFRIIRCFSDSLRHIRTTDFKVERGEAVILFEQTKPERIEPRMGFLPELTPYLTLEALAAGALEEAAGYFSNPSDAQALASALPDLDAIIQNPFSGLACALHDAVEGYRMGSDFCCTLRAGKIEEFHLYR